MLSEYIEKKLKQARYKLLKDGSYFGEIPGLRGVWANARNLEVCRKELQGVLEEWYYKIMHTIAIYKKNLEKDDSVVIPRREYEELLTLKEIREFTPTVAQKKALVRAENNLKGGKTLSYHELTKKLGITG